jgi:mono/diheme cytochrome c family protein
MMPRVTVSRVLVVALLAGLLVALPSQSSGQEPEAGNNVGVTAEHNFRLYCSNCHGEDGRGEGPKAFGLSGPPPDLTGLSARNGGLFPRERLHRIIDGREDIKVHGEREMPVWGKWFKMEAEENLGGAEGDEGTVQRRIESLIDFLETMQR